MTDVNRLRELLKKTTTLEENEVNEMTDEDVIDLSIDIRNHFMTRLSKWTDEDIKRIAGTPKPNSLEELPKIEIMKF